MANALGTTALASGAIILIVSGIVTNMSIAAAADADDDTLLRMRRRAVLQIEGRTNEALLSLGAQISNWAFARVSRALDEAKKDVFNRVNHSKIRFYSQTIQRYYHVNRHKSIYSLK